MKVCILLMIYRLTLLVLTALTEKFIDGLLCRVIEAVMVLVALSNYSGCRINYQVSCGFLGPLV